jgi:hypothetical protein
MLQNIVLCTLHSEKEVLKHVPRYFMGSEEINEH